MKKHFVTIVLTFIVGINMLFAAENVSGDAVTMVSYEQRWLDDEGTLSLKNNTQEKIQNVTFEIEYLDMNGVPVDYKTFTYDIDIDPGKTRKIDIPAYESSRHYQYFKTKDMISSYPSFKLNFKLSDYNSISKNSENENAMDDLETFKGSEAGSILFLIVLGVIIIGLWVGLYVLVAVMANKRNRNPAIWVLVSIFTTPLLSCIILLAVGRNDNRLNYD